jgi:CheY-like chemotaxis protein
MSSKNRRWWWRIAWYRNSPEKGTISGLAFLDSVAKASRVRGAIVIPADNLNLAQGLASRRRVLIAEDEILIRMDIADVLREQGWQVVETGTADEALAVLARDQQFAMVLTDVHMPGGHTGLDLARIVKQSYLHIKVAVMSGQHRPSDDDRSLFDLFLQKPITNIVSALSPLAGNIDD